MSEYDNYELYLWVPEIDYDAEEWDTIFSRCNYDVNKNKLDPELTDDVLYDKFHRDPNYYKIASLETFIYNNIYKPYSQVERSAPKIELFFKHLIQSLETIEYSFYFSHLIEEIKAELALFSSKPRQVYYKDDFFAHNSSDELLHIIYKAALDAGVCLFERLNGHLISNEMSFDQINAIIDSTPCALSNNELLKFDLSHTPNNIFEIKNLLLATIKQNAKLNFQIKKQDRQIHDNGVKRSYLFNFHAKSGNSEHFFDVFICQFSKNSEYYIHSSHYNVNLIHEFFNPKELQNNTDDSLIVAGFKLSHHSFIYRFPLKELNYFQQLTELKTNNILHYSSASAKDFNFITQQIPAYLKNFENIKSSEQIYYLYLYSKTFFIPEIEDVRHGVLNKKISTETVLEMYRATFGVEPQAIELCNHLESICLSYNHYHPNNQDSFKTLLHYNIPQISAGLKALKHKE